MWAAGGTGYWSTAIWWIVGIKHFWIHATWENTSELCEIGKVDKLISKRDSEIGLWMALVFGVLVSPKQYITKHRRRYCSIVLERSMISSGSANSGGCPPPWCSPLSEMSHEDHEGVAWFIPTPVEAHMGSLAIQTCLLLVVQCGPLNSYGFWSTLQNAHSLENPFQPPVFPGECLPQSHRNIHRIISVHNAAFFARNHWLRKSRQMLQYWGITKESKDTIAHRRSLETKSCARELWCHLQKPNSNQNMILAHSEIHVIFTSFLVFVWQSHQWLSNLAAQFV